MAELSVLIPARNERWLSRTVDDVIVHAKGDTEVIVVLDGAWPEAGYELHQHPRVNVIYLPQSIGQRAATNLAASVSTAKYVMKLDGHCSVDEGFDVVLMDAAKELGPDVTQIPAQHNLHVFDWVCEACGHRTYQGPTPTGCVACNQVGPHRMDIVWNAKRRRTEFWRFDSELHFQYWGEYKSRPEAQGDIVDVMTSLGACFFMERERFHQIGGLDEATGSWGQFGVEIALKSALSGGRHVVNKRTWFSHLFRTQGGDFGFPYALSGVEQDYARQYSRNLWRGNNWPGQVKPLKWWVEKFAPVPGWTQEQIDVLPRTIGTAQAGREAAGAVDYSGHRACADRTESASIRAGQGDGHSIVRGQRHEALTKGIVYYTDNLCPEPIASAVREQLASVAPGPIVSVSLKPIAFGQNITLPLERSYLSMFRQILAGLEALDTDIAFLCEHDCLYPASHFDAQPKPGTYLYNQHVYKVSADDGRALHYLCSQTSGLCADRSLLVEHYRKRVAHVEAHGYSRNNGFEPGTRDTKHGGFDDVPHEVWMSAVPIVDIRHTKNLTPSRWRKDQFKQQKYTAGWTEASEVPGWGVTLGRFAEFLREVAGAQQAVA